MVSKSRHCFLPCSCPPPLGGVCEVPRPSSRGSLPTPAPPHEAGKAPLIAEEAAG